MVPLVRMLVLLVLACMLVLPGTGAITFNCNQKQCDSCCDGKPCYRVALANDGECSAYREKNPKGNMKSQQRLFGFDAFIDTSDDILVCHNNRWYVVAHESRCTTL